jgi:hypothetical protein
MTIPQHPFRSQWQPIEVDVMGYRIVEEQHWKPFIFSVSNIQEKLQDSRSVHFLPLIPRIQSGTSE